MAKKKAGTALVSMKDLEGLYQADAQAAVLAAPMPGGVPRISTKSEMFSLGEQELPDPLELIVVAEALQNVWYHEQYDPDHPAPPACFAVGPVAQVDAEGKTLEGTGDSGLKPHETSPDKQGGPDGRCATCEKNQFGSAEVGRGKACANTRQLAVVMADDPNLGTDQPLTWAILGISATALSPWGKFVTGLAKLAGRPPHGVATTFTFDKRNPNERLRKSVIAKTFRPITDYRVAKKVLELRKEILATGALVRPLPVVLTEEGGGTKGRGRVKAKHQADRAPKARRTAGRAKFG